MQEFCGDVLIWPLQNKEETLILDTRLGGYIIYACDAQPRKAGKMQIQNCAVPAQGTWVSCAIAGDYYQCKWGDLGFPAGVDI
jgi:hypothetical protein